MLPYVAIEFPRGGSSFLCLAIEFPCGGNLVHPSFDLVPLWGKFVPPPFDFVPLPSDLVFPRMQIERMPGDVLFVSSFCIQDKAIFSARLLVKHPSSFLRGVYSTLCQQGSALIIPSVGIQPIARIKLHLVVSHMIYIN